MVGPGSAARCFDRGRILHDGVVETLLVDPTQLTWDDDFVFGDLDGDGRIELLAYVPTLGLRLLSHPGDGRFDSLSPAELLGGAGGIGAVSDVDGDGLDDVVLGAWSHSTPGSVMLNQGGGVFVGSPEVAAWPGQRWSTSSASR